jgi:hypothetical protein
MRFKNEMGEFSWDRKQKPKFGFCVRGGKQNSSKTF